MAENMKHEEQCRIFNRPSILKRMRDLVKSEIKTGEEHGFLVCKRGEDYRLTEPCKGTECEIELGHCRDDEEQVGTFHTHGLFSFPSCSDIVTAFERGTRVNCIGALTCWWLGYPAVMIKCMSIDVDHPEYDKFRDRILKLDEIYGPILSKWDEESERLSDEEEKKLYDKVIEAHIKFNKVLDEAEKAGVVDRAALLDIKDLEYDETE